MLSGFQLRAARRVLDLSRNDLAAKTDLRPSTIVTLETKASNLCHLKCAANVENQIRAFFNKKGFMFADDNAISLIVSNKPAKKSLNSLTRFQFKAARVATGLSQEKIAKLFNLSQKDIYNIELAHNTAFIGSSRIKPIEIKSFFKDLGIEFKGTMSLKLIEDPGLTLRYLQYFQKLRCSGPDRYIDRLEN